MSKKRGVKDETKPRRTPGEQAQPAGALRRRERVPILTGGRFASVSHAPFSPQNYSTPSDGKRGDSDRKTPTAVRTSSS
jgi:hypothetical protein